MFDFSKDVDGLVFEFTKPGGEVVRVDPFDTIELLLEYQKAMTQNDALRKALGFQTLGEVKADDFAGKKSWTPTGAQCAAAYTEMFEMMDKAELLKKMSALTQKFFGSTESSPANTSPSTTK